MAGCEQRSSVSSGATTAARYWFDWRGVVQRRIHIVKLPIALRVLSVLAPLSACGAEDGQDPYAQAGQLPEHHFNQTKRLQELTVDPHSTSDKLFIFPALYANATSPKSS